MLFEIRKVGYHTIIGESMKRNGEDTDAEKKFISTFCSDCV